MPDNPLPQDRRQEIFAALVGLQDQGTAVEQSRKDIAERFAISEQQVRQCEREGLDNDWPPL